MTTINVSFLSAKTKDSGAKSAPVLGPGTLDTSEAGLRFRGRRTRAALATAVGVVVGMAGVFGGISTLVAFDVDSHHKRIALFVGLACGVLPGVLAYRLLHRYLRGPHVDVLVPWSALRVLNTEANQATLRLVAPGLRGDVTALATDPASARALWALAHS